MFVKNCCTMYDGFTGINFEATFKENKISTAPINVNRTIFSVIAIFISILFWWLIVRKTWKDFGINIVFKSVLLLIIVGLTEFFLFYCD